MAIISKKKIKLKVNTVLKNYLISSERSINLPVSYGALNDYEESTPLLDIHFDEARWETVQFPNEKKEKVYTGLLQTYTLLISGGDSSITDNLFIDRIDHFIYGKTKPFRIRIGNRNNDNFEYFYVKTADASRIYGLELEHFLSPYRMNYLVGKDTIVEEHIAGIPGDVFLNEHINDPSLNKKSLSKEFVKFNESCFIRLLGDMHPGNFVIIQTPDLEETHFKIRAIDFDQQSYEGKKAIYMPQSYKRNSLFLELGKLELHPAAIRQYQIEERFYISKRIAKSYAQIKKLTEAMARDITSFPQNVLMLKEQLADHYRDKEFLNCKNMGEILVISLKQLFKKKN